MAHMRLFGRVHPTERKPVTGIRLGVLARRIPPGAALEISDLQLQPGRHITGWTPASQDLGVQPTGWQFRNGIIYGNQDVVIIADSPAASPLRWEITRANGTMRIGDFHLGHTTTAIVDGHASTATQGAGIPPHLTARSDIDVPIELDGRAAVSVWFHGLAAADPSDPLPMDPDPIDPDDPMSEPDEDDDIEQPPEPPTPDPDEPDELEDE